MSTYVDASSITRERLQDIIKAEQEGRLVILPFAATGLCTVSAGHIRLNSGDQILSESAKLVTFHVDPTESDRYDAEAARIIDERQTL